MPRGSGMPPTKRRRHKQAKAPALDAVIGILQARLGYKQPKIEPFYTTAKCQCGDCRQILPAAAFDMPFGPGRNKCRACV